MSNLTLEALAALAAKHGFPDPPLAAAVAMAESGGNPNAHGDTSLGSGAGSLGLWQIYLDAHPEYAIDPSALYDPDTNAAAAFAVSSKGTTWKPWSTAWEDPVRRIGYLGPKAPAMKFYKPAPPAPPPSSGWGGLLVLGAIIGIAWELARGRA